MAPPFNIFQELTEAARSHGVSFLVIGGHAVNAYGYQRTTIDADFLIRDVDAAAWRLILENLGYTWRGQTTTFIQFAATGKVCDGFPVDLMLVEAETFAKLFKEGREMRYGELHFFVPKPLHLIALKLHAMHNPKRSFLGKDLLDVVQLIRLCQIPLHDVELVSILERYATKEIRDEIRKRINGV